MSIAKHALTAGLVIGVVSMLTACGQDQVSPPVALSSVGPVSAEPQRPGNAEAGYTALVNEPYITCGIPYAAYKESGDPPKPSHLLPGRKDRNADLPYMRTSYVTKDGVELVTSNCLLCHAGFFNNELIVGLGNEFLDFSGDLVLAAESVGAYVTGEAEAAEWRKWADRVTAIAPYTMTDTFGVNPANNLTLALFAHRDPRTLAWSQKPLIEPPPTKPLPVSMPPWWRMKKKHALFYTTEGRGDHARFMMTASTLCTDSVEEARAIDSYFPDIRAYIASLEPPVYPFDIDRQLAVQGRTVFESYCSQCHGTYDEDWAYPNLVISLEEIGTDPEHALTARADRFIRWFNDSFYGELARAAPAPGYIAPPLDGVWATAPFLHNGSVPTIEALLDSSKRPTYWRHRSFDATDYNTQTLGWNYSELPHGKDSAATNEQRSRIYDTTLPGYSNQGHTFGDVLADDERTALLEYLKTL